MPRASIESNPGQWQILINIAKTEADFGWKPIIKHPNKGESSKKHTEISKIWNN
jgi:hypothetical protein